MNQTNNEYFQKKKTLDEKKKCNVWFCQSLLRVILDVNFSIAFVKFQMMKMDEINEMIV